MHGFFSSLLGPISSSYPQVCSGATYVNLDMVENKKDQSRMLLIEGIFLLVVFRRKLRGFTFIHNFYSFFVGKSI